MLYYVKRPMTAKYPRQLSKQNIDCCLTQFSNMTFDWLIKTEYFVIFHQNSNFWAQVSQDSQSCDKVTLVRPQANQTVRTGSPVMFHNDLTPTKVKKPTTSPLCV